MGKSTPAGLAPWMCLVLLSVAGVCVLRQRHEGRDQLAALSLPRSLASTPRGAASSAGGDDHAAWLEAARANLTRFQDELPALVLAKAQPFAPWTAAGWGFFDRVASCPPQRRPLGRYPPSTKLQGDGAKWLCRLDHLADPARGCVIYSLGSRGQYDFEQAMLNATRCEIHTFDCTIEGGSLDGGRRHHYHKLCIGTAPSAAFEAYNASFRTWPQATAGLGHGRVDLLKMDIESHEYGVLSTFARTDPSLPADLAMELHIARHPRRIEAASVEGMAFVFQHLARLGYAAVSREVNARHPGCCSEFTFVRLAGAGDGLPALS